MLEGHFFGAANIEQLYPMEKENTEEEQLMLVLKGIAEQTDMTIDQIVPYCEWNEQDGDSLPVRLQTHTTGLELETEDLISIGVDILSGMTLELDEPTENDTETETPVVEVESTDEVETTTEEPDENDHAVTIVEYLNMRDSGATNRAITQGTGLTKEQVESVVVGLIKADMVHKINKTVYRGPAPVAEDTAEPEMVEVVEIETVVAEDEPLAEKTNNAVEHALNTHFDSIRNLFNKVESNAEADSGYKSQAEQYTEVMTELRAHLDSIQREQGWLLAAPVWQVVALIAQWHPEA